MERLRKTALALLALAAVFLLACCAARETEPPEAAEQTIAAEKPPAGETKLPETAAEAAPSPEAPPPMPEAEAEGDGVRGHGQLRVENGKLVDESGAPFQLRGMSTHGVGWFPNYINAGAMASVRAAGGNVMRVAMYTQADSGYLYKPERSMELVLQAIENARAMDMYVIVDWHILDDGDPNAHLDRAITFFDAVASRYREDPAIVYEVCNEPNGVDWSAITQYAYAICPVIRQYAPNAVIVLGTPYYSSGLDSVIAEPFPAENILYAYHFYAGEHSEWSALTRALDAGLPVMASEWGVGKAPNGEAALDAGRRFAEYLNENGVSWCAWSLCNKDEVYSVLRPDCDKLSGWEDGDLTDVGRLIFDAMGGGAA